MLKWNSERVKNLTGLEIWLFIVARVLVGFGIGLLSSRYFPTLATPVGFSAVIVGLVLFVVATQGLRRTGSN